MIRFLKALVLLPVAIVIVLLAVANRAPVVLSFDPFSAGGPPEFSVQLPLFALLFATAAIGVVVGGTATWLAQGKHRRARRHFRREVNRLRSETERLRAHAARATASGLPSLPPAQSPTY